MSNSTLVDIIPQELLDNVRVSIDSQFTQVISIAQRPERLRTPYPAKSLSEFYGLVKTVLDNYQAREDVTNDKKVLLTEEEPNFIKDQGLGVIITFNLVKREPGAYGQGAPLKSQVQNLRPILREEIADPENPGFKRAILGYFHDNEVKFTVWAKTNKVANERALWFEGLMQEYSWYFTSQGVARLFFLKREADIISDVSQSNQKLYGRPIHFYVRTETLVTISEKTFEQISVGTAINPSSSLLND